MHNSDTFDLTGWPTVFVYRLLLASHKEGTPFPTVLVAMLNYSNWKEVEAHPDRITLTYREYSELVKSCELSKIANHAQHLLYYLSEELKNGKAE